MRRQIRGLWVAEIRIQVMRLAWGRGLSRDVVRRLAEEAPVVGLERAHQAAKVGSERRIVAAKVEMAVGRARPGLRGKMAHQGAVVPQERVEVRVDNSTDGNG